MKFAAPLILAVGLATCSQNVELTERARNVELVSHAFLGEKPDRCKQVGEFEVSALANESTNDRRYDILDVKALNEGARMEATHVLRWPDERFPCDRAGEPSEDKGRFCRHGKVTAYECIMGRPP